MKKRRNHAAGFRADVALEACRASAWRWNRRTNTVCIGL